MISIQAVTCRILIVQWLHSVSVPEAEHIDGRYEHRGVLWRNEVETHKTFYRAPEKLS